MNLTQQVRLYSIMSLKFQKQFPQHEFLAPHENYVTQWKILHKRLMVNKSPNKNNNSIIQILDNYDIDGKSLHCYMKDGSKMNLSLLVCLYSIMSLKFQKQFSQHEFLVLHENYVTWWKILHNRSMANKSPIKTKIQ